MARRNRDWDGDDRRAPAQVLVVNDEDDAATLLAKLLEGEGYRVAKADTHESALTAASQLLPRAIVLDLTHGGIGSNLKLLEAIRHHEDERVATTRVALLARQGSNRVFSFQSGSDAFITRPFKADDLVTQLGRVIALPFKDLPQHRRQQLDGY